jgi:hypothetical protein
VDIHHPQAERIRVALDNLSTHTPGLLYEAFPTPEAHRILRHLEFHFTFKHASWLDMVEIEIGVLKGQCLDCRLEDRDRLALEDVSARCGTGAVREYRVSRNRLYKIVY